MLAVDILVEPPDELPAVSTPSTGDLAGQSAEGVNLVSNSTSSVDGLDLEPAAGLGVGYTELRLRDGEGNLPKEVRNQFGQVLKDPVDDTLAHEGEKLHIRVFRDPEDVYDNASPPKEVGTFKDPESTQ